MDELHGILLQTRMADRGLRLLRKFGIIANEYQFSRTAQGLLIPLVRQLSDNEASIIRTQIGEVETQLAHFAKAHRRPRSLAESVRSKLPHELTVKLPKSFDVIGDIAIIELPEELRPYLVAIGQAILEINPHVRLALRKSGEVEGTYRTRRFEVVAGSGPTETVHHEFNCHYRLDVSTVYFNPRLSHERARIAQQVTPGEVVVDMFAGVGPYSVLIANRQPRSIIHSVDINPAAYSYLKENTFTNRVADRVITRLGDIRELAHAELRGIASRVVMNLPAQAINYLPAAFQVLKRDGGIIHFYAFGRREGGTDAVASLFRSAVESVGRRIESLRFCSAIREVAPNRVQVALDALVN